MSLWHWPRASAIPLFASLFVSFLLNQKAARLPLALNDDAVAESVDGAIDRILRRYDDDE